MEDDKARPMTLEDNYTEKDTGKRASAHGKKNGRPQGPTVLRRRKQGIEAVGRLLVYQYWSGKAHNARPILTPGDYLCLG